MLPDRGESLWSKLATNRSARVGRECPPGRGGSTRPRQSPDRVHPETVLALAPCEPRYPLFAAHTIIRSITRDRDDFDSRSNAGIAD